MDVHLTEESGFDVTREIMARLPRPILIVTGRSAADPDLACRALANGALDVASKLSGPNAPDYEQQRLRLTRLVHSLAGVPVLHRTRRRPPAVSAEPPRSGRCVPGPLSATARPVQVRLPDVLLIGASTGGPQVIAALLQRLPAAWSVPIVIAQHITVGFADGFARWLGQLLTRDVAVVRELTRLQAGRIYVAPDDGDLVFAAPWEVVRKESAPGSPVQPSIDALFTSAARHVGAGAHAILLTGMGRDGAHGLAALARCDAMTLAQSPETCTVDSMPMKAIALGGARLVLSPEEMADLLGVCVSG
jgi:two-component system chemotaxis response regulator CheB